MIEESLAVNGPYEIYHIAYDDNERYILYLPGDEYWFTPEQWESFKALMRDYLDKA